jgi:hypothetical protein
LRSCDKSLHQQEHQQQEESGILSLIQQQATREEACRDCLSNKALCEFAPERLRLEESKRALTRGVTGDTIPFFDVHKGSKEQPSKHRQQRQHRRRRQQSNTHATLSIRRQQQARWIEQTG